MWRYRKRRCSQSQMPSMLKKGVSRKERSASRKYRGVCLGRRRVCLGRRRVCAVPEAALLPVPDALDVEAGAVEVAVGDRRLAVHLHLENLRDGECEKESSVSVCVGKREV